MASRTVTISCEWQTFIILLTLQADQCNEQLSIRSIGLFLLKYALRDHKLQTPWRRALLDKLTVAKLAYVLPAFPEQGLLESLTASRRPCYETDESISWQPAVQLLKDPLRYFPSTFTYFFWVVSSLCFPTKNVVFPYAKFLTNLFFFKLRGR
jgi:hypothetical protein